MKYVVCIFVCIGSCADIKQCDALTPTRSSINGVPTHCAHDQYLLAKEAMAGDDRRSASSAVTYWYGVVVMTLSGKYGMLW